MWAAPRIRHVTFLATAVLAIAACAPNVDIPAYPLYEGPRLPGDQLVRVFGSIASVDGQDVSSFGSAFEVLPGCSDRTSSPTNATHRAPAGGLSSPSHRATIS
jgi:hypothetical protein